MAKNDEKQSSLLERIVKNKFVGKVGKVVLVGGAIIAGLYLMNNASQTIQNNKIVREKIEQSLKNEIRSEERALEGFVSFVDTVYDLGQPRFSYVDMEGSRFLYPHDDILIPGHYVRIGYVPLGARRINEQIFDQILDIKKIKEASDPIIRDEHMNNIMNECAGVITRIEYIEKAPKK